MDESDREVGAVEVEGAEDDAMELFVGDFFREERSGAGASDATVIDDVDDDAEVDR